MKIIIINGANLNLIGKREPKIYGNETFESYFNKLKLKNSSINLEYFQSNYEGSIINKIHEVGFDYDGIIINPGAFTHYSYAILDALKAITCNFIEVHISDIKNREFFRRNSVIESESFKSIFGQGLNGYQLAIDEFKKKLN